MKQTFSPLVQLKSARRLPLMREVYVSYLNAIYMRNASEMGFREDVSKLKINEISNWLRAWMFMEICGFQAGEIPETEGDD